MQRASMGSDSDDDFDDEYDEAQDVELGFVARVQDADASTLLLHAQPDWSQWDGGKVGGKPVWLNPRTVPTAAQLACVECGHALSFLLQIYCPLDDVADAFHRSLYVFCCRHAGCSKQGNGKVFRAQLPQRNALYPEESGVTHFEPPASDEMPSFCVLCNQRAVFTCSACHVARYCSKEHQKDHWSRGGHKQDCAQCLQENTLIETGVDELRAKGSKWMFPEYEMVIDHEPDAREAANEHEAKLLADFEKNKAAAQRRAQQDGEESDVFTDDSEIDITQRELNDAIGSSQDQDKHYIRFLTRVELAKDQVLRYSRWHEKNVLWVHSGGILEDENAIPACLHCGGERKFEFQVLPQLLFYLHVDQKSSLSEIKDKSCEWGTLAVYTCVNSCPLETKYAEEFLHYQTPYAGA